MINVWYFTDNKPGHENQILGLLEQLSKLLSIEVRRIDYRDYSHPKISWLFKHSFKVINLPQPQLIVGAGHRTHWPVLAASRISGAKSLIIMTPSLPLCLFDFIISPQHDKLAPRNNRLTTMGAMNRMEVAQKEASKGLILLGGPSKHYYWDQSDIVEQLTLLISQTAEIHWTISTSRRTPVTILPILKSLNLKNIDEIVRWDQCPDGWLRKQMCGAEISWCTPDSVSMVYESLTANCWVGVFNLTALGTSVNLGIEQLTEDKKITLFSNRLDCFYGNADQCEFNEAKKSAIWLKKKMSGMGQNE